MFSGGHLASFLGFINGLPQFEGHKDYQAFSSDVQAMLNIDGILSFGTRRKGYATCVLAPGAMV